MRSTVYTVLCYNIKENKVDYHFPEVFDNLEDASKFAYMGWDDEFDFFVAIHDLQKQTVMYI